MDVGPWHEAQTSSVDGVFELIKSRGDLPRGAANLESARAPGLGSGEAALRRPPHAATGLQADSLVS